MQRYTDHGCPDLMGTCTIELSHLSSMNTVEEMVVGRQEPEDQEVCCESVSPRNDWETTSVILSHVAVLTRPEQGQHQVDLPTRKGEVSWSAVLNL